MSKKSRRRKEVEIAEGVKFKYDPKVKRVTLELKGIHVSIRPNIVYEDGEEKMENVFDHQAFRVLKKDVLSIYCPDGIGDLHWVFMKLSSLKRQTGAKLIHMYVRDLSPIRPRRADEFIKMNPIVSDLTYVYEQAPIPPWGYAIESQGYDYLLDATPVLASGRRIEEWIPELETEYDYPFDFPKPENIDGSVVYYGDHLAEANWANGWGDHHWAMITNALRKRGVVKAVGLECDRSKIESVKRFDIDIEDMVGKTTFSRCLAMCLGAKVVVGSISGLTIMTAAGGGRVVALWPGKKARLRLPEAMRTSWIKDRPFYKPVGYEGDVTEVLKDAFSIWRE